MHPLCLPSLLFLNVKIEVKGSNAGFLKVFLGRLPGFDLYVLIRFPYVFSERERRGSCFRIR